jgi:transglutaminase-like putative cysteine protease
MVYEVTHTTRYEYDTTVSQCQSEMRLTPRSLPHQHLLSWAVTTLPASASRSQHRDYFGNDVTTLTILEPHDRFTTTATSVVAVDAVPPVASTITWEAARARLASHDQPDTAAAFELVFSSPYVPVARPLLDYARATFDAGRPLVDAVTELSRRIHQDFKYTPRATTIDTPLLDVLEGRKGVCQDYAHVMIGALRSLRLAARYVSGYLRSGADYQGSEASHAWVSVFVPGAGWLDVDPTNDVCPGIGHVTVAWGRDYGDVTPVRGVALGGGDQRVEVVVRVEPAAP